MSLRPLFIGSTALMFAISTAMGNPTTMTELKAGFTNPPLEARPGAFWSWLNANVDRDRIRYELEQMKEKGMSGAEIWDVQAMRNTHMIPAGPEFLSPESVDNIRFALAEAKKLGLRMGMITSSGWNAGGTWVTPDWAGKTLVFSSTPTTGPISFSEEIAFPKVPDHCPLGPDGKPQYFREVALLAVPARADNNITSTSEIINLTGKLTSDGKLTWDVPDGEWNILRFVCTNTGQELIVPSPNSKGLFIDFLDPDATIRHLQTIMDRLQITPENAAEVGLAYLEVDSMELHPGNPWTDKFPEWFEKLRGYDPTMYLPVLAGYTIDNKETSDAFQYDYRNCISDLLIHSHYETGSEFLAKYGIDFVGEAGGPGPPIWDTCPVDALKALGAMHIPRGEFWIQHRNMFLVKEVASAAHIYGKKLVDGEAFTTWRRWQDSPFELKRVADRAFAEGLNHVTIHTFAHSPESAGLPGRAYHAGIDINPNVTWWPFARAFMDYLARCSYMLRQGLPVADVLWYYGDQAPNFFPAFHDVPEKPRLPGLSRGYDFDVINSDVILNRLSVKDGRFVLPEGTSYRVLAFPDDAAMTLEVLEKLESLVKQGGVILGNPPRKTPGLKDQDQRTSKMQTVANRLWADPGTSVSVYGVGRVYRDSTLDDVLAREGVMPDVQARTFLDSPSVDFIHRNVDGTDIYFLRNITMDNYLIDLRFRVADGKPQIWDPTDGLVLQAMDGPRFRGLRVTDSTTTYTDVQVAMAAGGSAFVVFPKSSSAIVADEVQDHPFVIPRVPTTEQWTVTFPPGSGAPTSITLQSLEPLSKHSDPGVHHFSGISEYRATLHLEDEDTTPSRRILDLDVYDMAEVTINGHPAGIVWNPPYQVDVTEHWKPGANDIRVRVANLWHNRLVGDMKLPDDDRITTTNLPLRDKMDAPLLDSGLRGSISLFETTETPE